MKNMTAAKKAATQAAAKSYDFSVMVVCSRGKRECCFLKHKSVRNVLKRANDRGRRKTGRRQKKGRGQERAGS
jgi:hypothetical protein